MIGIFDSGVGGLTVMKEFLKRFPDFDYLYLGDQANVPYGSRSTERVNKLVEKNVAWMIGKGCSLIIIACNTASADALRHVQQRFVIPFKTSPSLQRRGIEGEVKDPPVILGVLVPAVEEALRQTRNGQIGVIATRGTVASGAYEREIQKRAHPEGAQTFARLQVRAYPRACPLLVPLIEEGWAEKPETTMILKKYLRPLKSCHIDTLILGCTHYPILERQIRRVMGKNVRLVDSGQAAAEAMKSYFERHPDVLERVTHRSPLKRGSPAETDSSAGRGSLSFYTTDDAARFAEQASLFLGKRVKAERVEI